MAARSVASILTITSLFVVSLAEGQVPLPSATSAETPSTLFVGEKAGDNFGFAIAGVGDVDLDGYDDLLVGSPFADANGPNSGSAWVLSGKTGTSLFSFAGTNMLDLFGRAVGAPGDVNQDGHPDLLIGAFFADPTGPFAGEAVIYSGFDGTPLQQFAGGSASDQLGNAVAGAGDVDNDGFLDVIVGVWAADANGIDSGAAIIFSGATGGSIAFLAGNSPADFFGSTVAAAGDVNGDGFDDVIVGAPNDDFSGSESGTAEVYAGPAGTLLFSVSGVGNNDELGIDVAGGDDLDDDGFDDVIVGARLNDIGGNDAGIVLALSGQTGSILYSIVGEAAGDTFGSSLAMVGDVDGDDRADFLVGAPQSDAAAVDAGAAYLYSGASGTLLQRWLGAANDDRFGAEVVRAGDVDADGRVDFAIGAFKSDEGGGDAGSVTLISECISTVTQLGPGCTGGSGVVPTLSLTGCLAPSKLAKLTIEGGLGGSAALLLIGVGETVQPLGAGCALYPATTLLSVTLPLFGSGPGNGAFSIKTALPANLGSAKLSMQAITLDPTAPLGAAFTNGLRVTIP